MIIRRFVTALRQQDWATVTIEFLIVVLGIFAGLEAASWNQNRTDRLDERAFLLRIQTELQQSVSKTQQSIDFQRRHAGYGEVVIEALSTCHLSREKQNEFASGIYLLGKYNGAAFIRASIEELLASGRLHIIENTELRQRLVQLLQEYEDHVFFMSDVQQRAAPHIVYVDSKTPIIVTHPIGGGADVAWDQIDVDLNEVCKDRRYYTAVRSTLNYTWDSTGALMRWNKIVNGVAEMIARDLAL